jgi:hypothetical protein
MIYIALLWLGAASSLFSSYSHAFNFNYLLLSVFDPFFNFQRVNAGDMGAMLLPKLLISKDIMPFRRIAAISRQERALSRGGYGVCRQGVGADERVGRWQ